MGAMKEVNADSKRIQMIEYGLVILMLFIILIILTPSFTKIISTTMYNSAKLNTEGTISTVKDMYASINLRDDVALPFTVEYKHGKYTLYEDGREYTIPNTVKIKIEGKQASSGKVVITNDGEIEVEDLKFGLYACNQKAGKTLDCKFSW